MEPSGIAVVVPGSQDDPFSAHAQDGSTQDQATRAGDQPASQPNPQDASQASDPASGQNQSTQGANEQPKGLTQAEVDALVQERLRGAQSGWDKRNKLLEDQNKALQETLKQTQANALAEQRRIQLESTPEHMRAQLQEQWNVADEKAELKSQRDQLLTYHQTVEALRIFQTYGTFGVTEEMLLECKTIEEMEKLALETKVAFFENGGKVPAKAATTAAKGEQKPAGQSASADLGGNPGAHQEAGLLTTRGVESMGANIKNMFSNGPNVPWQNQ